MLLNLCRNLMKRASPRVTDVNPARALPDLSGTWSGGVQDEFQGGYYQYIVTRLPAVTHGDHAYSWTRSWTSGGSFRLRTDSEGTLIIENQSGWASGTVEQDGHAMRIHWLSGGEWRK